MRRLLWLIPALALLSALGWYCRKQISNENFLYAGSDTYGFLKLADELRDHHRYALSPGDPLHYGRTPGYPIFLMVTKGDAVAKMAGGAGWWKIVNAQRWLDLVVTGLCVFFIAFAMRGPPAGLFGYAMAMVFPFTMIFFAAVFTETVAIALTTLTFALVAFDSPRLERVRHFAAGVVAALGVLLRPDGILVLPPLALGIWLLARDRRRRLWLGLFLAAGFTVAFSPWVIRNWIQFGKAYALGSRVDRYSNPVEHYAGFHTWLGTWGIDAEVYPKASWCFFDPSCAPTLGTYPPEAFDGDAERKEVERLLALRRSERFSQRVNDGFAELAKQRRHHHPIDNLVLLPAKRAWNVWINEHNDIAHTRYPWPEVWNRMKDQWWKLALGYSILVFFAMVLLLWRRDTRRLALVLTSALVLRTFFLAYFFYVEPRYTVEVMPLGLCLIAAAAFVWQKRRVA